MGTAMTSTTVATSLEVRGGFYFTQPDNVVMFDEVLSQTAKVVYCNLLSHVRKGTNKCKLYISTIAEEVKKSVRTVRRALSQLCERGVIVRLMQYGNKQNQLASLFVIIGKNAACYQGSSYQSSYQSSHQHQSEHQSAVEQVCQAEANMINTVTTVNAENAVTKFTTPKVQKTNSGTKMASLCETKTESEAVTETASLPKVSAPHAKNGRQNNDKGDNENILRDTLIGQAELPKSSSFSSSSSSSSSSLNKKLKNDHETAQILIDFNAQEEQELRKSQAIQVPQRPQETSGQKERLTGLSVAECTNESDENKADEHSNSEILSEINSKTDDAETVIETAFETALETVIETVITPESAPEQASASSPEESPSEDLLLSEEVETNSGNTDNSTNNEADNNSTFDASEAFDPLVCVPNADKIPNDMLDTARYFLYRTGRNPRSINEKEIQAMREVFVKHYPARIQKEIDVACRRFVKNGKSLRVLFFGYIATALRKQQSLVPFDKKLAGRSARASSGVSAERSAQKLAKHGEDGNIKASNGQETSQLSEASEGHRYLTSEDISDKTNPLSSMSMEELLALEKELDSRMKKIVKKEGC